MRQRQFVDQPLQPGATRQSYQDSDIFGTKPGSEIVQKSALVTKEHRPRYTNTFARSDVIGNADDATKLTDGKIHNAQTVVRHDKNWASNVFAAPENEQSNRRKLGPKD